MLARTESSRSAIASRCSRRSISVSPAIAPHLDVPLPDETTRRPAGPKPWLADVGPARQVRALSGGQHDLARNVLGGLGHEGLPRVRERVDRADLRAQLALVDEAGNGAELGTARVPYEMNDADVVPIGLRRSHDGHQGATGLDDGWGMSEHVAAACVVDQIDGTDRRLPTVPFDVDEIVGAELEHALSSAHSTGPDDVGAGPTGELHSDRPDSATRTVDHHGLSGLEVSVVEQRLPRGEP